MGIEAISEAIGLVAAGNPPRIDQDHALSTYEPPARDEHAQIRWYEPAPVIHCLIRGSNPQPGAWTVHEGGKLRFFDCRLVGSQEPGMPGRVLRIDDEGFDVRLNGGVIRVLRVQAEGGKKMGAGEWARESGLKAGFRFR
jgi:methionyl-tRNA formyltransferase